MKKFKLVVVTFIAGLLGMPLAYAECDATETNKLSSLANNVKVSQEIIQKEFELGAGDNPPDGLTEEEAVSTAEILCGQHSSDPVRSAQQRSSRSWDSPCTDLL